MVEQYIKTDIGKREYNEDFAGTFVDKNIKGFILCDGLGGCGLGNLAAENTCENFIFKFKESSGEIKERIDKAMLFCNEALCNLQTKVARSETLKTTLCALVIDEEFAYIVHCGDSRVYHFANGNYIWRTKDHSVPQLMALMGEIEENKIRKHVDRNKLLRAIGMGLDEFSYEIRKEPIKLCGNDSFVLCSDGFWEYIAGVEMARILRVSKSVKDWTEVMFDQIKQRNNTEDADNYTAVAVFIKNESLFDNKNDKAEITISPLTDETEEPITSSPDYSVNTRKIVLPADIPDIKGTSVDFAKTDAAVLIKTEADKQNSGYNLKKTIKTDVTD